MASIKIEKPVGTQPSASTIKKTSTKAPTASKSTPKKTREPKKKVITQREFIQCTQSAHHR
ncbi:hypothetical protein H5410_019462 [Solanum commersonii]|uniref:Uncharacterized protein n=1 Tax=Solanum commersonii TaxID=4109 RepID=A0A9J5Z7G7_SOLCO|nr:hypothetical protein H5410_019462 [Solanum commersonii]